MDPLLFWILPFQLPNIVEDFKLKKKAMLPLLFCLSFQRANNVQDFNKLKQDFFLIVSLLFFCFRASKGAERGAGSRGWIFYL